METVTIKHKIPLDKWARMNENEINRIASLYCRKLYDATCDGYFVELIIIAPSVWRYILIQNCLGSYRYC